MLFGRANVRYYREVVPIIVGGNVCQIVAPEKDSDMRKRMKKQGTESRWLAGSDKSRVEN